MQLSVSKIKTYNASKAKFAGKYILWIKEEFESDALILGKMFEHWLFTWEDTWEFLADQEIRDMEE